MENLSKTEIDRLMAECEPYLNKLYASNKLILDAGVDADAKSLQLKDGKLVVSNKQGLDSKYKVGGAFIIEAEDFQDAVQVASLHPAVQLATGEQLDWGIEIRPIYQFFNKTTNK